jgi:hypothetical protein
MLSFLEQASLPSNERRLGAMPADTRSPKFLLWMLLLWLCVSIGFAAFSIWNRDYWVGVRRSTSSGYLRLGEPAPSSVRQSPDGQHQTVEWKNPLSDQRLQIEVDRATGRITSTLEETVDNWNLAAVHAAAIASYIGFVALVISFLRFAWERRRRKKTQPDRQPGDS